MKWWLAPWVLCAGACLPAYDNFPHSGGGDQSVIGGGDMSGDMAQASGCTTASTYAIGITPFYEGPGFTTVNGPVLRLDGCNTGDPSGVSAPATSNYASAKVPQKFVDDGLEHYLILEGAYTGAGGGNVLRTWYAPKLKMNDATVCTRYDSCNGNFGTIFHFSGQLNSLRYNIAKELGAHPVHPIPAADAASETTFATHFSFAYGWVSRTNKPEDIVGNASYSADGNASSDKTSCDVNTTCCVYYAKGFDVFFNAPASKLLDFAATTTTSGAFVVVCPVNSTNDVTITQTNAAVTGIPPFSIPRRPGDAVQIEYVP